MMNDRNVWQAVYDALNAADREPVGPPPTAEELLAYENGTLRDEDRDRIRRRLAAYPELATAFAAPLPEEGEYLDDEVVNRQWQEFQREQKPQRHNVVYIWQAATAIAATLTIVFAALYWHAHSALVSPRVDGVAVFLAPGATRGVAAQNATVAMRGDSCVIAVVLAPDGDYPAYRLELTNAAGAKIWSGESVPPPQDTFFVTLTSAKVPPGGYTLSVDGIRGSAREHVATYAFDVTKEK